MTLGTTALNDSCRNAAVDRMIAELQRGPLTLVAIGPLTDIACVALNSPAAAKNIREVVAIMGRAPGEELSITDPWTGKPHTGLTDFNYVMDPRAAGVVLQSQIPLTFMTFDLTKSTLITRQGELTTRVRLQSQVMNTRRLADLSPLSLPVICAFLMMTAALVLSGKFAEREVGRCCGSADVRLAEPPQNRVPKLNDLALPGAIQGDRHHRAVLDWPGVRYHQSSQVTAAARAFTAEGSPPAH